MGSFAVIIVGIGSAWANSINTKVEKISAMEVNIQYIQTDIKDIKAMIKDAVNTRGSDNFNGRMNQKNMGG